MTRMWVLLLRGNSNPDGALALGVGAGLWTFFKGFHVYREYKLVGDVPRMPIRSIAMGLVHIRGKAQAAQLVTSPVTHTPCCFYKVEIEHWKVENRSGRWESLRTDADGVKFYVEDATGKVLVDSHSAEYDLPAGAWREVNSQRLAAHGASAASDTELLQYVETSGAHNLIDKMQHFLEKKGPVDDPRRETARQTMLQMMQLASQAASNQGLNLPINVPAELVEKFASVRGPLPDPEKEKMRQMFLEHIRETGSITIPQRPTQGASGRYRVREYLIMPEQEYNVTGTCAENRNAGVAGDSNAGERTMIVKGENEKTFLISWQAEEQESKTLARRGVKMIFGGAALAVICLALLLAHLKLY